jgi:hypothetical protein
MTKGKSKSNKEKSKSKEIADAPDKEKPVWLKFNNKDTLKLLY